METGVIFTCKYFKFGLNTTGLSQSHFRNLSACSINELIKIHVYSDEKKFYPVIFNLQSQRDTVMCYKIQYMYMKTGFYMYTV